MRRWGAACHLAWGDFHARSGFTPSTIPEEKWGLLVVNLFGNFGKCSSSRYWKLPKVKPDFLVEWKASDISFLSFFFNLLNRCNKATYTIPFVMNEHSVY